MHILLQNFEHIKILFCSPMTCMAPFMSSMSAKACRSLSTKCTHIGFLTRMGIHVIFKVSGSYKGFRTQAALMSSFTKSCVLLLHVWVQFGLINHCSTYWTWYRFMCILDVFECLKIISLHFHKLFWIPILCWYRRYHKDLSSLKNRDFVMSMFWHIRFQWCHFPVG